MTTDDVARLIQATRTFVDIVSARDDLGAMDALRNNVFAAKKAGMFNGLFEIARFLSGDDAARILESGKADADLAAVGLDRSAVEMARGHAKRFTRLPGRPRSRA